MTVVVLGSINADLVVRTDRLPDAGETVRASSFAIYPGGKGANQAAAAALMGARVNLIGRVGDDANAAMVRTALAGAGVEISAVTTDSVAPTGTALITVADEGQNTIVTAGGANHSVGPEELEGLERLLPGARMLLLQLEIPMDVVAAAVAAARAAGVAVMLDPAPVADIPDAVYAGVTWITPNEQETGALTGIDPSDDESARRAADSLARRGVENVVITLGSRGCYYGGGRIDAPRVRAVDTVACGDAFNGALAAGLAEGLGDDGALRLACAAGAAAATTPGAFDSLPTRGDVDRMSL
jgi:ribokinase